MGRMSIRLSDLAVEVKDSYMPNKSEELPYIGLEHVEQGSLHLSGIGSSKEVYSHKFRFKMGDILFGTLRPYFRKIVVAPCDGICSTEFSVVRAKNPDDQLFVFYAMAQPLFIKYATTNSKGARPRTKWKLYSDFELPHILPSQRRDLGKILSAYDDLIETNRRRIQLLEQAARLLYKEWFVHLRFPGHEHVKIKKGVPEGWEKTTIGKIGTIVTGKTPSKKNPSFYGSDVPFIKTPDMHGNAIVVTTEEMLSEEGAQSQANKTLPPRSILISCIGSVGVVAFNGIASQTNQQINAIVPHSDIIRYWTFFMAKDLKPLLDGMGGGATMANVNKSKFSSIKIVIPPRTLLEQFNGVAIPIFDQIEKLSILNNRLAKSRDLLLPRLMNGEIAV